ncbi:MAG TPA: YqiA/YcfP family alpha/beta fold hydrolase [Myxococcota bacterium]|nr:YqiA/YcfP family alpha/beta fold hydrolase [Myxococcota bacterium]HON25796.1 YqiA/YcfP family alpha/beta fold hydrolase [Myxococcota bacterium]HOS61401.1 YqiA/YcfP family alpha/beta fold hydrolase [Myxococcota bacterium]HPC93033.1 YqiA/YcfP family alpha/beta fold hydrolase [Myxococcota bacterium]HPL25337.1 YqiA/YcfP family alpha/beta fold hydrolase [Myxococcota bacterium]
MLRYAYLHGFSSGPNATKGTWLANSFGKRGVTLALPDLNSPSFAKMTLTDILDTLDEIDRQAAIHDRWRFIGSSLGGYVAALWSAMHPGRCDRLVLLCPGFGLQDRWHSLVGQVALDQWKKEGRLLLADANGDKVPVHYELVEDMARYPKSPATGCPTLIIHGTRDDLVPIEQSRRYAMDNPDTRLIEVDDDHLLRDSIELIDQEAARFFAI